MAKNLHLSPSAIICTAFYTCDQAFRPVAPLPRISGDARSILTRLCTCMLELALVIIVPNIELLLEACSIMSSRCPPCNPLLTSGRSFTWLPSQSKDNCPQGGIFHGRHACRCSGSDLNPSGLQADIAVASSCVRQRLVKPGSDQTCNTISQENGAAMCSKLYWNGGERTPLGCSRMPGK